MLVEGIGGVGGHSVWRLEICPKYTNQVWSGLVEALFSSSGSCFCVSTYLIPQWIIMDVNTLQIWSHISPKITVEENIFWKPVTWPEQFELIRTFAWVLAGGGPYYFIIADHQVVTDLDILCIYMDFIILKFLLFFFAFVRVKVLSQIIFLSGEPRKRACTSPVAISFPGFPVANFLSRCSLRCFLMHLTSGVTKKLNFVFW